MKIISEGVTVPAAEIERFRREAETLAKLNHPGITVVYDTVEDKGRLFHVMEYLDGKNLASVVKAAPAGMPVHRVLSLAAQVADVLHAAHEKSVVHRDIKPANLMLLAGDKVKVCDFGIALPNAGEATRLTGSGLFIGTHRYMAPEQYSGTGTRISVLTCTRLAA